MPTMNEPAPASPSRPTRPTPPPPPRPSPRQEVRSSPGRRGARRRPILGALLALVGIVLAVIVWGGPGGSAVDGTATIRPSGHVERVILAVEAGTIELVSGDELLLEATASERTFVMDSDQTDGVLRVEASCPRFTLLRGCRTAVRVVVPAGVAMVASTEAGTIAATGLTGGADLRTTAGTIDVHELEGTIRLRSDAGDLRGSVLTGTVEARTTAGAIAIRVIDGTERVDARTEVGSIDLIVPDTAYEIDAGTTLGRTNVDVAHTPGAARLLEARSELGSVSIRSAGR